jgi:predicted DCC family thiol-disulfide oxidoreductase YuxK
MATLEASAHSDPVGHLARSTSEAAEAPLQLLQQGPLLLFDGECGVCAASVQWVLAHERSNQLRFAALQSQVGRAFVEASGLPPQIDSLLWLELEAGTLRIHYYADAVRAVLRYVGGAWSWLDACFGLVPRALRDFGYRWFARHRQSVAAKQCLVPTPDQRARFFERPVKLL